MVEMSNPPAVRDTQAITWVVALRWGATFLAFPVAGLLAKAAAGPVDSWGSAVLAGAVAGAVIGAAQAWGGGSRVQRRAAWAAATALGLAAGLAAGSAAVGWRTDLRSLALEGAVSGLGIGLAQAPLLAAAARRALAWPVLIAALWALGWTTTTAAGVDVDTRWAVFGASGALVVTLGTGLALWWVSGGGDSRSR